MDIIECQFTYYFVCEICQQITHIVNSGVTDRVCKFCQSECDGCGKNFKFEELTEVDIEDTEIGEVIDVEQFCEDCISRRR